MRAGSEAILHILKANSVKKHLDFRAILWLVVCREVIPITQQAKQAPMPKVLISNPMRHKFNFTETKNETAPASDHSLAGAVLYSGEVMRLCIS